MYSITLEIQLEVQWWLAPHLEYLPERGICEVNNLTIKTYNTLQNQQQPHCGTLDHWRIRVHGFSRLSLLDFPSQKTLCLEFPDSSISFLLALEILCSWKHIVISNLLPCNNLPYIICYNTLYLIIHSLVVFICMLDWLDLHLYCGISIMALIFDRIMFYHMAYIWHVHIIFSKSHLVMLGSSLYLNFYHNPHHVSYRINLQHHRYSNLCSPIKDLMYNLPVALRNTSYGQYSYWIVPPNTMEYQYHVPEILGSIDCLIWSFYGTFKWPSDQSYPVTIGSCPYQQSYNNTYHGSYGLNL